MGEKGEGSGGEGGGKWGERGRELGMGYPPVHPLLTLMIDFYSLCFLDVRMIEKSRPSGLPFVITWQAS